jgi:hypothetical protein
MKTLRNSIEVSTLAVTLLVFSLIVFLGTNGLPGRTLAMGDSSHALVAEPRAVNVADAPDVAAQGLDIVIDHNDVDAAAIPQADLDEARQLVVYFNHRSIGNNILDGIADLATQNPTRYSINVNYGHGTSQGINHYMAGNNGDPMSKISGFSGLVKDGHDVAFMKFCVGDFPPWASVPPADIWSAYRDAMETLQTQHPGTEIVWLTSPLTTQADGRGLDSFAAFNDLVRQYVAQNGGVLFDIADVESHDPSGNPVTSGGYEAMYNGYSDDGAHLNVTGRQRVASAMWSLLAQIAGWEQPSHWISVAAASDVASVYPGEVATYTLSVTASEGFVEPVALALQGAPSGTMVSFNPSSVVPPGTSQLGIVTTASTRIGTYAMTVTGTSGQLSDTAALTLTVKPTLNLAVEPVVQSVPPGDTAVYTLSVSASEGYSTPVTLNLQGQPSGTSVSFDPNPVTPSAASQLRIATTGFTAAGVYAMTAGASSGVLSDSVDLALIVTSGTPTSFTLGISPTLCVAGPGQVVSYTVDVTGVGGFSQPVTLVEVGLPKAVGSAWGVNPVTPDGDSLLTLSVPGHPPFGDYLFYVAGISGAQVTAERIELLIDYPYKGYLPTIMRMSTMR